MSQTLLSQTFGKLKVIEETRRNGRRSWICQCECGRKTNVITSNLTRRKSTSCGKCTAQLLAEHHKEYMVWSSMKSRCDNPKHLAYKDYGARGITYQTSWKDFRAFLLDMGPKPTGLSLDRINNAGHYTKENCRWATNTEQKNNMRTNRLIAYDGKTQTMAQWAREFNINYRTLKSRLNISKWPIKKALITKPNETRNLR